jgi:ABC-type phosphate transport system auxiliary subunit
LAIIPYKKAILKKAFATKVADLRTQMASSLNNHFEAELQNSVRKLEDNIDPYSRFINTEKEKADKLSAEFHTLQKNLGSLRKDLNKYFVAK